MQIICNTSAEEIIIIISVGSCVMCAVYAFRIADEGLFVRKILRNVCSNNYFGYFSVIPPTLCEWMWRQRHRHLDKFDKVLADITT